MEIYLIAEKRERRGQGPADWPRRLEGIEGVRVVARPLPHLARVEATPDGIERARRVLGESYHIEPVIPHHFGQPPPPLGE